MTWVILRKITFKEGLVMNIKLSVSCRVSIVADMFMGKEIDLRKAILMYGGFNVNANKFSLSADKKLLKYNKVVDLTFDSYAEMVACIDKRIKQIVDYDLATDNWSVQARVDRVEFFRD